MANSASQAKPKADIGKRALRVLVILFAGYALLTLLVMFVQRRLIYFPTRFSLKRAESVAAKAGFQPWRNASGQIVGWHLPGLSSSNGAVLIVHGNAGSAVDRDYLAKPIRDAGNTDVFVLEYPGYGARDGSPSQQSILAAADEALTALSNHAPIYVVSESLGAGAAAHLARKYDKHVAGLMLLAPYDNLASVAQKQMPLFPVSLLLWDRFNPAEWLKDYRGPVGVVVAGADQVIPPEFGRRLHDGYAGPKRLQIIPGAGHNDVAAQPSDWWKEVFAFWQQNERAGVPSQ